MYLVSVGHGDNIEFQKGEIFYGVVLVEWATNLQTLSNISNSLKDC